MRRRGVSISVVSVLIALFLAGAGGLPIFADGKVVGAIGVSGGTSSEDAQVATAGVDALKK